MDRGAWRATIHSVAKSGTRLKQLSTHTWGRARRGVSRTWSPGESLRTHPSRQNTKGQATQHAASPLSPALAGGFFTTSATWKEGTRG